jgi:NAD(P)-dependent dehydrogenase (short-subunit alcohol dehydrogenase family)
MERLVARTEQELGPISLLVNNAGVISPLGPMWEVDPAEWWQTLDVNLRGPLLGIRAVVPRMIPRGRGRIINLASAAGLQAIPYGSAYVVSKTALIRLTETLALEVQARGLSVFAVHPGDVRTDMTAYLVDSPAGQRWVPWFARIFEEGQDMPAARVADLVCWIAAGHADALSGRFIGVGDDVDALLTQVGVGGQEALHTLRLRT